MGKAAHDGDGKVPPEKSFQELLELMQKEQERITRQINERLDRIEDMLRRIIPPE